MDTREGGLFRWQWSLYPGSHRDRRNLALHAATQPLFVAGTCAILAAPLAGPGAAAAGVLAIAAVMGVQLRGHKLEGAAPATFRGPADVVARFFAEQWISFPRYVLSGKFAEAWRAAGRG